MPEAGADYYLPQNVPHGQVHEIWYHSSVTGTWRDAWVYLPPDYDTSKGRYPVLYLQRRRADESGWNGRYDNFILDVRFLAVPFDPSVPCRLAVP